MIIKKIFFVASICLLSNSLLFAQQATVTEDETTSQKTVFPESLPNHYPSLQGMLIRSFGEENYPESARILTHALSLRPYDGVLMSQLVAVYALQQERSKAYNLMLVMQQQGLAFDFDQLPQTEKIRDTESYTYINNLLKKASDEYVNSQLAFRIPADVVLPEAIAWDSKTNHFAIGTVADAKIMLLDDKGQPVEGAPEFAMRTPMGVFDIVIDSERRELLATTTAVGQQVGYKQSDYGKNALLRFDLDSGQLKAEYSVLPDGQPHGLGSLALASDGTVYVADLRSPFLYFLAPDSSQLELLAGGPALPNVRGIALNEAQNVLYVADQNRGLALIDLNDRKPYLLGVPEKLNLGGIEGIDFWNNYLVIIQPGMNPNRVMQLELSPNGRAVGTAIALEANHPEYHAPNYGVVANNNYYYMASSHWTAFDLQGNRLPGSALSPVPVLQLALAPIDNEANQAPRLQDVLRQRQERELNAPPPLLKDNG